MAPRTRHVAKQALLLVRSNRQGSPSPFLHHLPPLSSTRLSSHKQDHLSSTSPSANNLSFISHANQNGNCRERDLSSKFVQPNVFSRWTNSAMPRVPMSHAPHRCFSSVETTLISSPEQNSLGARRREYERQVAELRKQYKEERAEKARQAAKAQMDAVRERVLLKESKMSERKEQGERRRAVAMQALEDLKGIKLEERTGKAKRRKEREALLLEHKQWEEQRLRRTCSDWIDEADIEKRILEAMLEPVQFP
eukprot:TRINITY_DN36259_c0_g1_i1.p1 TRINITY_DN36259_c0_g1~~TRINITY_DN36259_c0_g1_i1.p1  ORF type:complete len:252 (+),score=36.26 TRINITY_DN36259_c0_g1_i1:381-1136(+)